MISEIGNSTSGFNYSGEAMNDPSFEENVTDLNIPLNPGYLLLSFPPKINLTYLVFSCIVS